MGKQSALAAAAPSIPTPSETDTGARGDRGEGRSLCEGACLTRRREVAGSIARRAIR